MDIAVEQDKIILLSQAKCLVRMLQPYSFNSSVPGNLTSQNITLYRKAKSIFGKEVDTYVAEPPTGSYSRAASVRSSATSLVSYLETKMGDPVASQMIGNELETARWAMKQGLTICAVLLCRVVQEQTMRRLCDKTGIEYAPNTQPSALAQKLRDENGGPFEKHVWKSVDAKLTFEGEVLHARVKPESDDVKDLIDWTEKFTQMLGRGTSV